MTDQANPLSQFYRKEKFFTRLPSRGKYYSEGVIEFNEDGEVGVMPMTSQDEVTMKNPDYLLTGKAVYDIIKSCVPGVKQPKKLLSCDIDTLLICIRRASYGNKSDMSVRCPECDSENTYSLDLEGLLDSTQELDSSYEVVLPLEPKNVTVFLMPSTFDTMVKQNKAAFQLSKAERALTTENMSDEMGFNILSKVIDDLSSINFEIIRDSIGKIVYTDDNGDDISVTNKAHIKSFLDNIDSKHVDMIEDMLNSIKKVGIQQTMPAKCSSCGHEWNAGVDFNPVNFF